MKNSLLIFIIFILVACNTNETKINSNKYVEILKMLSPSTDFSKRIIVLIIPFDGCSTCFSESVKLISKVEDINGLVIFPEIHSRRVNNFLHDNGISKEGVLIDSLRLTITNKIVNTNPKILLINNNKLLSVEDVKYENIDKVDLLLSDNLR